MTLTGRAAAERPDVNTLTAVRYGIVTHISRVSSVGRRAWMTAGPGRPDLGHADQSTGTYRSTANSMTENERRDAGLRRNGRPR